MKITSDAQEAIRIRQWVIPVLFLFFICIACSHGSRTPAAGNFEANTALDAPPDASGTLLAENTASEADADPEADFTDAPGEDASGEASFEWLDEFGEAEAQIESDVADPLSGFNRVMFWVNDTLYFAFLKPVATAYRELIPSPVRTGVYNFFNNLAAPIRFVNCLLQGKGEKADAELVRFTMNTTIGVLGFGNPAGKYPEYSVSDEDLGQTLGSYGIGQGFYLVLPIIGATTLRDGVGLLGDRLMWPVNYVVDPLETQLAIWGYEKVNTISFRIGDYETLKAVALDPYEALRDAYIQNRKTKVAQ